MKSQLNRVFSSGALMAAGALLLAGCSGGSGGGDSGSDSGKLTFVTYGSAFQEAQEKAFVEPFEQESGSKVTVDSPTDPSKLRVMVENGDPDWDVYLAGSAESFAYCGTLFEKIDFANIAKEDFAPGTISDCGVPVDTYSYVLVYNTEKFGSKPPTRLQDFFDTRNFPGTRSMSSDPAEGNLEMALLADGVPRESMYPLNYDRAFAKLDQIKKDTVFWNSGAEQVEMLESGRADMMLAWSGRAYEAVQNGAKVSPVWDKNAYHWASLSIVKGAKNKTGAQAFIDFSVKPEQQAAFAENIAYGAANLKAEPKLDSGAAAWDSGAEEHRNQSWSIDPEWWGKNADEVVAKWTTWTAG